MSAEDRERSRAARDARIRDYLLVDNMTDKEIADREGLDPSNLGKIYSRLGIVKPEKRKGKFSPVGLTKSSAYFRLGTLLSKLKEQHNAIDVSHLTGLTEHQQGMAIHPVQYGGRHNWTLAQMHRLADALERDPMEMMLWVFSPPKIGFATE